MKNLKRSFSVVCDVPSAHDLLRQGLAHHQAGGWVDAAALYERALAIDPNDPHALHLLGVVTLQLGDPARAVDLLERATCGMPDHGPAFSNLGNAHAAAGDLPSAVKALQEAVRLDGANAESRYNLGNVLSAGGDLTAALAEYEAARRLEPGHLAARFNAANTLAALERHAEATDLYRALARQAPDFPSLWTNLGVALASLERLDEATDAFREAVRRTPSSSQAWNNLGGALSRLERHDEATGALEEAVRLAPGDVDTLLNLVRTLQRKKATEAIDLALAAARLAPGRLDVWTVLGDAYLLFDRAHQALAAYRQALALDPTCLTENVNLGMAYLNADKHDEAHAFFDAYLARNPDDVNAWADLALVHAAGGDLERAFAAFREAFRVEPCLPKIHSNLLVILNYAAESTPAVMLTEARLWAERNAPAEPRFPAALPKSHDRLRVGYVSGDFRVHPVARFVERILGAHDRSRFEIFAYSNCRTRDEVTDAIQARVDAWREVAELTDDELAVRVREDGIDVLIDLNGHTPLHRLSAFARRMAPVQATWLGYFGTTGVEAMDFILADRTLIPERDEPFYTERPAHLANGLYFHTLPDLDLVPNALPALSRGHVTFGCHNLVSKINRESIALWAEVLRALPDSRMVLNRHPFQTKSIRERYYGLFEAHGVARERIDLVATMTREDYLRSYHDVDVMLDTTPFGAATTSYDALWMGVPIVSLSSDRFPGRMTESILKTAGLADLVPEGREGFVDLAVGLATDLPRLAGLRATLRPALAASRLCDLEGYTRDLEATFEWMWSEANSG